ncbi:MAG: hypothetical protein FWD48_07455 [Oscillospiraceae bacterium]|nr:hypothetical protein [Oscillospiraceae bacterium]
MKIAKIPKLAALLLSFIMLVGLFAACGDSDEGEKGSDRNDPPANATENNGGEQTQPTASGGTVTLPDNFVGVDFANGNIDFLMMHYRPLDSSPNAKVELVQWGGANVAKITPDGDFAPYLAIDADSLLGDRIADVAAIEIGIAVQHADGFHAVQGEIVARYGSDGKTAKAPWSVFLETRNPNVARMELKEDERMIPGNFNMFIIDRNGSGSSVGDNSVDAGGAPGILYVTFIGFRDDAGNFIPVNADAGFNEPRAFNENIVDFIIELGVEIGLDYGGMNCANSSNPEHQVGWLTDGVDSNDSPYLAEEWAQAEQLILEFAAPPRGEVQLIWLGDGGGWRWTQEVIIPANGTQSEFKIDLSSTFSNFDDFGESESIKLMLGTFAYHVECTNCDDGECDECGNDGMVEFTQTIADLQLKRAALVVFE